MEQAIAMRMAFNADQKEFEKFSDNYSNEDPEEREKQQVEKNVRSIQKLLGG